MNIVKAKKVYKKNLLRSMFYLFVEGIDINKKEGVQKEMVRTFLNDFLLSFSKFFHLEPSENGIFAQTKIFSSNSEKRLYSKIEPRFKKKNILFAGKSIWKKTAHLFI